MPKRKTNIKYLDDAQEIISQDTARKARRVTPDYKWYQYGVTPQIWKWLTTDRADATQVYNKVYGDPFIVGNKENKYVDRVNKRFPYDGELLYKAVVQYLTNDDNAVDRRLEFIKNSNMSNDDKRRLYAHEDLKDMYIKKPQRYGLIHRSEFVPTNNDGHYHEYYTSDTLRDEQSLESIKQAYDDMKRSGKTKGVYIHPLFNNYTAGIGVDPQRGEYISTYDKWDFNTAGANNPRDNMAQIVKGAEPVELYDRFYLDDWYGADSRPEPGDYYGGYTPEITVTGVNYKNHLARKHKKALGGSIRYMDDVYDLMLSH